MTAGPRDIRFVSERRWRVAAVWAVVVLTSAAAVAGQPGAKALPDPPGSTRPSQPLKPRLAPLAEGQWTEVHKNLVAKYATDGRPGNALRTLLTIPALADSFLSFPAYLSKDSTLQPRHREILILRTAWLVNNDYIWSSHVPAARAAGLTAAEIRRVAEGPAASGWNAFEATLLRVADQLFRNSFLNDADYKALAAGHDVHHTMDAVMTVTDFLALGMIYNALGIQPDQWSPDRIPADVSYRVATPRREAALTTPRVEPVTGTGLAIARTFARHPAMAAARKELGYINQQMKLDARTRELVILRIGWNCQSEYEWAQHVGSFGKGREMGLPIENIARGPAAPGWSALDQALLTATDELYRDSSISDRTWSALTTHLDTATILNVIVSVAQYRQVSIALNTFGVPGEPGDTERLPVIGAN
jgi:4-carboxymuconolactone decarboxylase